MKPRNAFAFNRLLSAFLFVVSFFVVFVVFCLMIDSFIADDDVQVMVFFITMIVFGCGCYYGSLFVASKKTVVSIENGLLVIKEESGNLLETVEMSSVRNYKLLYGNFGPKAIVLYTVDGRKLRIWGRMSWTRKTADFPELASQLTNSIRNGEHIISARPEMDIQAPPPPRSSHTIDLTKRTDYRN